MEKKKSYLLAIVVVLAITAALAEQMFSIPQLDSASVSTMKISVQDNGMTEIDVPVEDIPKICEAFNKVEKQFSGFTTEKEWRVEISVNNKSIYIGEDTIVDCGMVNRKFKVREEEIEELVEFLKTLKD